LNPFIYYTGRALQLLGLIITFEAIIFYFGRPETGKLMGMGFGGAFIFLIGWLIIRK
jgi:hypothetical protein